MTEFRFEPMSRRWVIAGGDRTARPNEFIDQTNKRHDLTCPFCGGREKETPPAVVEYPSQEQPWSVRVVPNKYPAVQGGGLCETNHNPQSLFQAEHGHGIHEVIIESPRHVIDLTDLTDEELVQTFLAYRDRLVAAADSGLRYAQVFKNVGAAAGASIEHSHSQLIALPWLPANLVEQLEHCRDYHTQHGRPLLFDLIDEEKIVGTRIVAEHNGLVAWFPYASRFSYECWLTDVSSARDFRFLTAGQIAEVAMFARDLIHRIKRAGGGAAYNLVLHTLPFDSKSYDHYHWYWEILPRVAKQAGFEWATGHFINPVLPETAAAAVRQIRSNCSVREN